MRKIRRWIPLAEWADKNGYSVRQVQRLAKSGEVPTKLIPVLVLGIPDDFIRPKKRKT